MALLRQQKADAEAAATKDKPVARDKPADKPAANRPPANKPAAKPKPQAAGSKPAANRSKTPAQPPKPAVDDTEIKQVDAATDGKAEEAPARGNGTAKGRPTPAKTNGKTPSAGGKPVGAGSSARPRNTSAKKRRRR
jgi:translation initiation factor IF-2